MDEQQQPTAAEMTVADESPATAQPPAAPKDNLTEFLAAGGTFGMALRNHLAQAQLSGSGAAKLSGEHLANLLYGAEAVEQHTAPYTGREYPNPRDYDTTNRR